jgi:hypothetical protein
MSRPKHRTRYLSPRQDKAKIRKDLTPASVYYETLKAIYQREIENDGNPSEILKSLNAAWIQYANKHNSRKNITPLSPSYFMKKINEDFEINLEVKDEKPIKRFRLFTWLADWIYKRGEYIRENN